MEWGVIRENLAALITDITWRFRNRLPFTRKLVLQITVGKDQTPVWYQVKGIAEGDYWIYNPNDPQANSLTTKAVIDPASSRIMERRWVKQLREVDFTKVVPHDSFFHVTTMALYSAR